MVHCALPNKLLCTQKEISVTVTDKKVTFLAQHPPSTSLHQPTHSQIMMFRVFPLATSLAFGYIKSLWWGCYLLMSGLKSNQII
jgi:hypothetical protein